LSQLLAAGRDAFHFPRAIVHSSSWFCYRKVDDGARPG